MSKSRYKLPDTLEPSGTKCASITIPDDPDYIAAVTGALYGLTKPYEWQNDEGHNALGAAARMLRAFETLSISDDCTSSPLPWCGLSDFHDGPISDIWEPSEFDSRGECYYADFDHGYRLNGNYSVNGASQLCVIHCHFNEPIHVTRARIGWICIPGSNVGSSNGYISPGSNPNDESVYVQTSQNASDWNGFDDTDDCDFTNTDFIVRVQANCSDPGDNCDATLIILGINLYGDGPAPPGMSIC